MQSGEVANWVAQFINSHTTIPAGGENPTINLGTYTAFSTALCNTFAPANEPAFAYSHLKCTKQGPIPIKDFISEFKTYVRCSGITDKPVIIDLFR